MMMLMMSVMLLQPAADDADDVDDDDDDDVNCGEMILEPQSQVRRTLLLPSPSSLPPRSRRHHGH